VLIDVSRIYMMYAQRYAQIYFLFMFVCTYVFTDVRRIYMMYAQRYAQTFVVCMSVCAYLCTGEYMYVSTSLISPSRDTVKREIEKNSE